MNLTAGCRELHGKLLTASLKFIRLPHCLFSKRTKKNTRRETKRAKNETNKLCETRAVLCCAVLCFDLNEFDVRTMNGGSCDRALPPKKRQLSSHFTFDLFAERKCLN